MKKNPRKNNKHDRLEEAMALLIQNQATFVQNQAAFNQTLAQQNQTQSAILQRLADLDRELAEQRRENAARFARIEEELAAIRAILLRHEQILQSLPEAIREKIGFNPSKS
jgi:hypothetical protein